MGFPGATVTEENLLTAECDILVPAAGERQITADIARNLKAKVRSVCVWVVRSECVWVVRSICVQVVRSEESVCVSGW